MYVINMISSIVASVPTTNVAKAYFFNGLSSVCDLKVNTARMINHRNSTSDRITLNTAYVFIFEIQLLICCSFLFLIRV